MSTTTPTARSLVTGQHRAAERWLASLGLMVTGGIHLALVPEHFHEATYAGVLFLADSLAALVLAGLVLGRERGLVWAAVGLVGATTIAAYVVSRTVGLPALGDDVGNWTEPLSFPALLAETTVTAIAVSEWVRRRSPGR